MAKIELNRLNDAYHFEAINDTGNKVEMDGSPDIGGQNKGIRPMQMLLAAAGGCSAIDVISILKKRKQDLKDIKITVEGEREPNVTPSLYTDIHITFRLFGTIDRDKAEKAVALSLEKYCSVAKTLELKAKITSSIEIIPA